MDIVSEILGLPAYLQLILETINPNSLSIKMMIASTDTKACCPICQMPSTKIHSHYERTLVDLNFGIYQVHWGNRHIADTECKVKIKSLSSKGFSYLLSHCKSR